MSSTTRSVDDRIVIPVLPLTKKSLRAWNAEARERPLSYEPGGKGHDNCAARKSSHRKIGIAMLFNLLLGADGVVRPRRDVSVGNDLRPRALFARLTGTTARRYVIVGQGTHFVMMERNRMQLFREVQLFLDER